MSKPKGPSEENGPLTKEAVLAAIAKHGRSLAKRDLARVLDVKGEDRRILRQILEELEEEGKLARAGRRTFASADAPPESGVIEITGVDDHGDLSARALGDSGLFGPQITVPIREAAGKGGPAMGIGDRALARITQTENGWVAKSSGLLNPVHRAFSACIAPARMAAWSSPPTAARAARSMCRRATPARPRTAI